MLAPEKVNISTVISHSLPVARTLQILSQRCLVDELYPWVSGFLCHPSLCLLYLLTSSNRGLATCSSQIMWRLWEKRVTLGCLECDALFPGLRCLLIWRKQCLLMEEGGKHVGFWWADSTGLRVGASGKRRSLRRPLPAGSLPLPLDTKLDGKGHPKEGTGGIFTLLGAQRRKNVLLFSMKRKMMKTSHFWVSSAGGESLRIWVQKEAALRPRLMLSLRFRVPGVQAIVVIHEPQRHYWKHCFLVAVIAVTTMSSL